MGYKIAWFTEGNWNGKVPLDHPNMRNDMAWMHHLNAAHHPIGHIPNLKDNEYDLGIITIPKTKLGALMQIDLIKHMRRACNKITFMQEGPYWLFQDYPMEQQIWFYNTLMEMDALFVHNRADVEYFSGITNKKCYLMKTLMITDNIKPHIVNSDARSGVMIGGNMVRWYGGFDSYLIAQEFGEEIFAPSMGRRIDREDEMDITHLEYMTWINWINNLSRFKYAVHLMPTQAAGTFTLNCAYHGIPCIGYRGLDTQEHCHPQLSVRFGDIKRAKELADQLKNDSSFYETQSRTARNNFSAFYGRDIFDKEITESIEEIMK